MVLSTHHSIMHPTLLDGDIISIEPASQKAWEIIYLFRFFSFSAYKLYHYLVSFLSKSEMKGSGFALRTLTTPKYKAQSVSNYSIASTTHE